MPKVPHFSHSNATPGERNKAIVVAQREVEDIIARKRVQTALSHKPPIAHTSIFTFRQRVFCKQEKRKLWAESHMVR